MNHDKSQFNTGHSPLWNPLHSNLWSPFSGSAIAGGGGVHIYPLDDVGGVAPLFAYSTKKLTDPYAGPALRVVRPSDSATLDVGFVGQNLDTASLDAFLGSEVGQVDIWYDQSGNGNNATQTTAASRPSIGVLTIGGVVAPYFFSDFMTLPAGVSTDRRTVNLFAVVEHLSVSTQSAIVQLGSGSNQITVFQSPVSNALGYLRMNPNTGNSGFPPIARPAFFEGLSSATQNYVSQNEESLSATVATSVTVTGGSIGSTTLSAGYEAKHYGAMYVCYGRILSAGERSAFKAGCESLFDVPESVLDTVVFEGDSIVAASAPDDIFRYGFAKQAERLLSRKTRVFNITGGGNQIQNEIGFYANQAGAILSRYSSDNRIVFLHIGTNDLTIGGRSAAQIYADIQTYAASVQASGGKIVVSTILPNASWSGAQQTTRDDLNTLIRDNWGSFADGFADFAADATMGPQSAAANNALYPDGLHPSRLGHSYLAPIAAAAIEALL